MAVVALAAQVGERKRGLRYRDDMDRRTPGPNRPIEGSVAGPPHLLVVFENLGRSDGFSGNQAPDPGRGRPLTRLQENTARSYNSQAESSLQNDDGNLQVCIYLIYK